MQNNYEAPIGVFDSGVGGLTVVKSIAKLLPHENIIYFGDIARLPYGTKSNTTIKKFATQTASFLLKQKVKAIVIACNTISAIAKDEVISLANNIPVLDVITAGSEDCCRNTQIKNVGIIATPATINSNAYLNSILQLNNKIKVYQAACSLFVPIIEEGLLNHQGLKLFANDYLQPLLAQKIDGLILGCTHYPLIQPIIQEIIGDKIKIIDPAISTALNLSHVLSQKQLLNSTTKPPSYQFYVTELTKSFLNISELILQQKINQPTLVNIE
jgi:glutamate racemase